jgi:DNA replication protein DnaC
MTRICKRFENCSLENYCCDTEEQKKLVAALQDGIKNGFSKNIIIVGGVGTGKTHLAYAIINALAEKKTGCSGYRWYAEDKVIYRTIKEIIDNIHDAWTDKSVSDMNSFCSCPLLIIDEIGVQYGSDSERTELYTVFNRRYEDELPIFAISNNKLSDLQRILGQRIYDRLTGGALIFELNGRSHRQEEK